VQNILVTGGAGYIGSHACKALALAGFRPVTLDNLCLGHRHFVRWGPLVEADVRNTEAVEDTIRRYNIAGVLHFAAFAYVGESVADPAKYYENNVNGTISLLRAMRQTGLSQIVFSSTCAVYGTPKTIPIAENETTSPLNPYGRSKLVCETILMDHAASYGVRPVILRYFNASGADSEGELGEKRETETRLIPRAMMSLLGHLDDFEVFGSDFPTPDGTAIRDYIHVSDLADAHVLALRHLLSGGDGGVFNLGVGQGYSVQEVLQTISAVTGRALRPASGPRRAGDPPEMVANAERARRVLGFKPKLSDLRTIIETAWNWHLVAHPEAVLTAGE
jgi:UDP-arabinose 4-epimerase